MPHAHHARCTTAACTLLRFAASHPSNILSVCLFALIGVNKDAAPVREGALRDWLAGVHASLLLNVTHRVVSNHNRRVPDRSLYSSVPSKLLLRSTT